MFLVDTITSNKPAKNQIEVGRNIDENTPNVNKKESREMVFLLSVISGLGPFDREMLLADAVLAACQHLGDELLGHIHQRALFLDEDLADG